MLASVRSASWTASEFEKTLEDSTFDIDKKTPWPKISNAAKDLLKALDPDHEARLEAKDALRHPWLADTKRLFKGECRITFAAWRLPYAPEGQS